jgi:glutamine synthetase
LSDPVTELREFLARHPAIEAAQLVITDPNGIGRGKLLAREELAALYARGRCVAGSILALDTVGEDVDGTGLVWAVGDADQLCRPVPGTLSAASWLARPTAQLLASLYTLDGQPAPADPRHVLACVVERARGAGFEPVVAAELEFYLLERTPAGELRGAPLSEGVRTNAYGIGRLEELGPAFDEIYAAARAQGLPVRTLMSEYAPGQYELTLEHRFVDRAQRVGAVLLKRTIRGVASRHGLRACFMAKPFETLAGSGLHLHLSLQDADGRNLFAAADPAGTPLLRHAIGGLRATLAESMAVLAPTANSYRRFRSGSYAPVAATWGVNNRSVGLRVPAGPAESRHVEHRLPGADANPYLVAAVVLAGALHGIERELDPGPAVEGNGYAQPPTAQAALPLHWPVALERAAASDFLRAALGERFLEIFLAIKRHECERFGALVSNRDWEWYADI